MHSHYQLEFSSGHTDVPEIISYLLLQHVPGTGAGTATSDGDGSPPLALASRLLPSWCR